MKYVVICTALYDYQAQQDGEELSFNADDTLYILDNKDPDWHKAQLKVPVDQDAGPIGLIPSNYVEKAKPIGFVKALYDYEPQSIEEVAFKEDDILTLYEKDDPDWYVVEKTNGDIGLAPSNYVESCDKPTTTKTPASPVETTKETLTACEPKWAIALFSFTPESSEETSLDDHEQVLITDYISNKDWWTIEHKDGTSGIVPSSYVKFQDEYEAELRAEQEQEEKKRAALQKQEQEQRDKERQREMAEHNRIKEQEEKERARQAEAERRRKMQEEAKQREIDAKKQASFAAASPQLGSGSPRRSQIPAPPPPSQPISSPSITYHPPQTAAPSKHLDPSKPDPTRIRMWTDRTGAFKVEAQFLSCANGKIRLHKTNGVKIDVPTQKMCVEDLRYIEQETGMKLLEDKSDNIPLAQLSNHHGRFSWLEYFKKANLPHKACVEYAGSFDANKLTEQDIERLTHSKMKMLGMSEKHVRRIQRFIETNRAEPPSDDESSKPKMKTKKSVTFGSVSYIPDSDQEDDDNVQWQIEQDERLARQLQEEEQGQTNTVGLQRRGTARPTPSHSAPRDVNSSVLVPQQFHSDLLKPVPAAPVSTSAPAPMKPVQAAPAAVASAPKITNAAQPGFEDDAWTPRAHSPSVQPASTSSWTPPQQTPPQMPPRQRPTPQLSQQSMVDPQLLAKWSGSPALATANTNRPVPPPPSSNTNKFASLQQIQQQQQQQLSQQISNASVPAVQSQTALPVQNTIYQQPAMTGSFTSPSAPALPSSTMFNSTPSLQVQQQQQSFINASPSLYHQPAAIQQSVPLQSVLPPALAPQATGYSPQMTGASRNWANATPDNPFGGNSPMMQSAPVNQFQQQQQPVYQNSLTVQHTGYVPPSQPLPHYNSSSSIDPNDKYSVFKTIDTTAPSVFNNNNNQQQQRSFYY